MRPKSARESRRVSTANWTMPTIVVVNIEADVHFTPLAARSLRLVASGSVR